MKYIIVDMEFNSLSEENTTLMKKNIVCPNEIIQIGAVKLNQQLKIIETLKLYIKPVIYSIINHKVKELTGITEEDLHKGISFTEALGQLQDFIEDDSIVCSWAKDDIVELARNAVYHQCGSISCIHAYLDLQEYCTKILALKNSISLKNALNRFCVSVDESKLHDGLNDSLYTAEVFRRSFNYRAVQNYIIRDINHMPAVPLKVDENFQIKQENIESCCPRCKREVSIEYPLKAMKWRFIGVGYCERCKINIMQEVVVKKSLVGEDIYKNSNRILNEEEYRSIIGRLEKIS